MPTKAPTLKAPAPAVRLNPVAIQAGPTYGNTRGEIYHTTRWRKLRARLLRDNPLCVYCEREDRLTAATDLDHIVPIRLGGDRWDERNLQLLCRSHHAEKSAKEGRDNKLIEE